MRTSRSTLVMVGTGRTLPRSEDGGNIAEAVAERKPPAGPMRSSDFDSVALLARVLKNGQRWNWRASPTRPSYESIPTATGMLWPVLRSRDAYASGPQLFGAHKPDSR